MVTEFSPLLVWSQWLYKSNPQYVTDHAPSYLVPKVINTSNHGILAMSGTGDSAGFHPVPLLYYRSTSYIKFKAFNANTELTTNATDNYSIGALVIGGAI